MKTSNNIIEPKKWTREELEQYVKEQDAVGREERIREGAFGEGLEEGLQKGILQGQEAVAIRLLIKKMPLDDIVELSGLSLDQVENLKNKI